MTPLFPDRRPVSRLFWVTAGSFPSLRWSTGGKPPSSGMRDCCYRYLKNDRDTTDTVDEWMAVTPSVQDTKGLLIITFHSYSRYCTCMKVSKKLPVSSLTEEDKSLSNFTAWSLKRLKKKKCPFSRRLIQCLGSEMPTSSLL